VYLSLIPIITGVALSSLDEPSFDAQGNNALFAPPCVYSDRASASKRSAANQLRSLMHVAAFVQASRWRWRPTCASRRATFSLSNCESSTDLARAGALTRTSSPFRLLRAARTPSGPRRLCERLPPEQLPSRLGFRHILGASGRARWSCPTGCYAAAETAQAARLGLCQPAVPVFEPAPDRPTHRACAATDGMQQTACNRRHATDDMQQTTCST
jgi:hypothetical protein